MESPETLQGLERLGWRVVDVAVNGSGRMVKLIKHIDGRTVALFHSDAADLARHRVALDEIIERNRGADLADPWPVRDQGSQGH